MRDDQLKIIKYNHLIANLVTFHNCQTITPSFKELESKGMQLKLELLAAFSPYRTHHLIRFGLFELRDRDPPW
ncbi:transposase [Robbsia andropogonis]|nr:transposase [Robbsia andropogonis]MCP1131435.1 transposase [Robbsia andropogonis]